MKDNLSSQITRNHRKVLGELSLFEGLAPGSLEELAQQKTATMRWIQILAIGLAFLNFCFIVFKFIARLSASDHAAALARQESERILGSVREGLFLLTRERTVGSQRSSSLDKLFGDRLHEFYLQNAPDEDAEA